MLGKEIIDAGFESAEGIYEGLGLLDGTTRFVSYDKHTRQVRRTARDVPPILSSMGEVEGYEIHMGVTEPGSDQEALVGDGRASDDGLVFGTYMHGMFQNPTAVNALLSYLYAQKKERFTPIDTGKKDPYDELSEIFETHVDMNAVVALVTG
jgi:adenosylcobyric acid synthase